MHVDLGLQPVTVGVGLRLVAASRGTDQPAPERGGEQRGPLRNGREEVAVARGLSAEGEGPAGPQHPGELRKGLTQIRDVV